MSAQEIIAELEKLDKQALEHVDARLRQLLAAGNHQNADVQSLRETLLQFSGKADGLPADYSINLDHYLYGLPKRQP